MTALFLPEKQQVIGVGISQTDYAQVVGCCRQWAQERRSLTSSIAHYICAVSVHGVIAARDDPQMSAVLNEADIATPDGMPLVWALRSLGVRGQQRVYGPTLMLEICRDAARTGDRIFLYGSREDTLHMLAERLRMKFPGIVIAGSYAPPFRTLTTEEDLAVQDLIRATDSDIIFVGISTPKQEKWMHTHRSCFPGVTMIGVGAAFDFHAGRTPQAPGWMQRNGLEWLFRLAAEPARLWRRYLLVTPRFLPLWAMQKLRSVRKMRLAG